MALLLNAGDTVSRSYSYTQPSPLHPSQPEGTGERTGNLWDEEYTEISPSIKYVPILVGDGTFTLSSTIPLPPNGAACLFFFAGNVDSGAGPQNRVYDENPRTLNSIDGYITIAYRITSYDPRNYQTMLNTGSTALPYEPYGYKIPISSANTTTNVYLGEVETTRRVKKLVLDGTETYIKDSMGEYLYYIYRAAHMHHTGCFCSHLVSTNGYPVQAEGCSTYNNDSIIYLNFGADVMNSQSSGNTVAGLKEYLAAQYAAGTPVTVWYVLANEETGIVNEPLRKIGDYADEVSGITIPTIAGANTISVGTTLQPSEVTVNYKGWHPVQSVHERENGAWT